MVGHPRRDEIERTANPRSRLFDAARLGSQSASWHDCIQNEARVDASNDQQDVGCEPFRHAIARASHGGGWSWAE